MKLKEYDINSKKSIVSYAQKFIDKSLNDVLEKNDISDILSLIGKYNKNRKGLLGDIVEKYLFGINNNNYARADFEKVKIELKTTGIKKLKSQKYSPKERLSLSMINYMSIVNEKWETSSFLEKNKLLLIMFYLSEDDKSLLEYKFKMVELIDLISGISKADVAQIKQDWQKIVEKIKKGEAHNLSEADTLYLGAAPKASTSKNRRIQPYSEITAKPRAFSLKTKYLNYLIQKILSKDDKSYHSIIEKNYPLTIEENIEKRFEIYYGKTNLEIEKRLNISYDKRPKNHRRLLINKLLGASSNKIKEFEKANITLRVIALEKTGRLVESISFPIFKYTEIINQDWTNSSFYKQLTEKKFLFVIFQKTKKGEDILKKVQFWNFPFKDINNVKWVWEETKKRIKEKKADKLPSITENSIAHVRPHGRNSKDVLDTGYGKKEVKKCFWLNAKYIQNQLNIKNT